MRAVFSKMRNQLLRIIKKPLFIGVIVPIVLVATTYAVANMPSHAQPQKTVVTTVSKPQPKVKAAVVAPTTAAVQPTNQTVSTSTSASTSSQKSTSSTASATPAPTSTTGGAGIITPLPGIPTTPTIKLQYTSAAGGAHFISIYSYNLTANTYEFIIHPVHSTTYTSDFDVAGYLNLDYANPSAEPDQQLDGNPALNMSELNDGDVYTISACSYDSGLCGVISSNTVTLTVSRDYIDGTVTYNYSQ